MAVCVLVGAVLPDVSHGAPVIAVENPVQDLGVIRKDGDFPVIFKISNIGKSALEIRDVKAGCGCTVPRLPKRTLTPGETMDVEVVFRSAGWRGVQRKVVQLVSNDPVNQVTDLTIQCDIQREIEVHPASVALVAGNTGDSPSQTVVMRGNPARRPFRVTAVETGAVPFVSVDYRNIDPGRGYRIDITATREAIEKGSMQQGKIIISTDNPDYDRIALPVRLHVVRDILVVPETVQLRARPGESTAGFFMFVRSADRQPVIVEELVFPAEGHGSYNVTALRGGQARIEVRDVPLMPDIDGANLVVRVRDTRDVVHETPVLLRLE